MVDILLALIAGLTSLLDPEVFAFMLLGITFGLFFGIIPGLSGLSGMGILLPFAIGYPPEVALAFLLGMYAVTTQSDSIPAILIGVPGTSAAQATYIDGYPMAKRGEGGRALSASYFASIFGTIVFAAVFIVLLPFLRWIIGGFGAPEFFAFGVLGLAMAGSLVGNNVARGLAVAALGLLLSTVGFTGATGEARYTFGAIYLEDGVPLIPIALGLFAIPEVIDLLVSRSSISSSSSSTVNSDAKLGFKDVLRNKWLVLRTSLIGGFCGLIPGLGGSVAEWMGYGHAVNSTKTDPQFGKGDVRGVIAAEAATAAQKPGALIPTLVLGIPGNASMALLMGALLIVGVRPGHELLTSRLPLTFQLLWTVIFANLIIALVCLRLQTYLVRLCFLPAKIIAPIILAFMIVGASLTTATHADLLVFSIAGVVGYAFKHTEWSRVPLMIGLVLGPLIENNFIITSQIYGFSWLWERPIVLTVSLVAVGTIVFNIWKKRDGPSIEAHSDAGVMAQSARFEAIAPSLAALGVGIGMGLIGTVAAIVSTFWQLEAMIFPLVVGSILGLTSMLDVMRDLASCRAAKCRASLDASLMRRRLRYFGSAFAAMLLAILIGIGPGMAVFLILFMLAHRVSWLVSCLSALFLWLFVELVLRAALNMPLPEALLS